MIDSGVLVFPPGYLTNVTSETSLFSVADPD